MRINHSLGRKRGVSRDLSTRYNMKNVMMKIKENKKTLGLALVLTILIMLVLVVISVLFVKKDLNEYKIKNENIYMYFGEEKFEFNTDVVLDKDNNITSLKANNKKIDLYSEPVYIKNKKKVIFPKSMNVVFPKSSFKQYKINYYTVLTKDNEDYKLTNKNLNYRISTSFLYDGNDLYFFITKGTVSFSNQSINISPMSYVNYSYGNGELYIYNYDEDKVYYYPRMIDGDVIFKNDAFELNISSDSVKNGTKNKLLRKNINDLDRLK